MPDFSFTEILIMILVGLLFFKENILGWAGEKFGFKNDSMKKNDRFDVIEAQLNTIGSNHLTHMEEDIRDLVKIQQDCLTLLKNIKEYGIRCQIDK